MVPQGNYPVGSVDGDGHLTTTDPVTGKVIEGDKNVTYVYKLVDTTPEKPVTPTPGKPEQPTPGKPVDPALKLQLKLLQLNLHKKWHNCQTLVKSLT